MLQTTSRRLALVLFVAVTAVASANDVARFVNLGFSADSGVFMFGQYGITSERSGAYAEIYTVDVPGNRFVADGVEQLVVSAPLSAGQDGMGALISLVPSVAPEVRRFGVSHLRQGRLIYLLVNGEAQRPTIEFRDFESGARYQITTVQNARGEGESGSAAFHLELRMEDANGRVVEEVVGLPDFYRAGVNSYRVNQVILAPNNRSLVMVIERITNLETGRRVRYMVETVHP